MSEAATFSLLLDGRPVDVLGRVGSDATAFTSHNLARGQRRKLPLRDGIGRHELRVRYSADTDNQMPDVIRTF